MNSAVREVDIELGEQDWDERKNINKRKKIILQGRNPDQVAKEKERRFKQKRQLAKQQRQKIKNASS